MDAILGFFSFINSLGVSVVMPIVITILGCVLGAGFGKSLRAGLTVGIGFIGLNLVINSLLGTTLAPAVQEMIERFGFSLSVRFLYCDRDTITNEIILFFIYLQEG